MDNRKFLEVLFSTKNNSKIKEFNKLSSIEKQEVLSNDKVLNIGYMKLSV